VAETASAWHFGAVLIYKILLPAEWAAFQAAGRFDGSPFDHSSGYVHCSSREQVGATAARFFADEPALVILALDAEVLGGHVRWEQTPDHGSFPHVYAALPINAVVAVHHAAGAAAVDESLG
jgi:uncharacterized protein (DUF952 family)